MSPGQPCSIVRVQSTQEESPGSVAWVPVDPWGKPWFDRLGSSRPVGAGLQPARILADLNRIFTEHCLGATAYRGNTRISVVTVSMIGPFAEPTSTRGMITTPLTGGPSQPPWVAWITQVSGAWPSTIITCRGA
jgi:hypothetical protein